MNIPILLYHAIQPESGIFVESEVDRVYTVTEQQFDNHMCLLRKNGFQTITLQQFINASKDRRLQQKSVIITFDDVHRTTKTIGLPILKKYGQIAEYFITVNNIGRPSFVTREEIGELEMGGMSVQSHALDHIYLNELDSNGIKEQLERSKDILEDLIKRPVQFFAPPGGRITSTVVSIAKSVGYKGICTSQIGGNSLSVDFYALRRWPIKRNIDIQTFERILNLDPRVLVKHKALQILFGCAKKMLGNQRYDKFRQNLLALFSV